MTREIRPATEDEAIHLDNAITLMRSARYWMSGAHDGMVIADLPDSVSGAALSAIVGSTGTFKNLESHELLTQEQLGQVLSRSKGATQAYQPPGQQG